MKRHLRAILAGDIVGFSRLMERDEAGTIARQRQHFASAIKPEFEKSGGNIVKLMGDGMLVEFESVVDAVGCAVAIQQAMQQREAGTDESRRIRYRMGINLGDVFYDDDDILGDAVNIAARLEPMADPGGICISGTVYDHLKSNLSVSYAPLGEVTVKNIATPIRAYKVLFDGPDGPPPAPEGNRRRPVLMAAALVLLAGLASGTVLWRAAREVAPIVPEAGSETATTPATDRIGIAVLPFDNLSSDPEQEYFSDGITEDLITDISRVSGLFVIARNTMFTYKNNPVNIQDVGRDLGVDYVLEGSIRRSGNQVRINAQLIDASSGGHVWAERFDRELTDIFALQDSVVRQIVQELNVQLHPDEVARLSRKEQVDPEAYDLLLRGLELFRRFSPGTNARAREFFQAALDVDPGFPRAMADLALTYGMEAEQNWVADPRAAAETGRVLAEAARKLDPEIAQVHFVLTVLYRVLDDVPSSIAAANEAVALDPNYADGYATLASSLTYAGRADEALEAIGQAFRLNPIRAFFYTWIEGLAYYVKGDFARAEELFQLDVAANAEFTAGHKMLAAALIALGRQGDAEWAAAELLATAPDYTVASDATLRGYADPELRDRLKAALRKAGLP